MYSKLGIGFRSYPGQEVSSIVRVLGAAAAAVLDALGLVVEDVEEVAK